MIITALSFLIISCLLLWAVVYSRGHWGWKVPVIVLVPLWIFAVWFALESFSGYPTTQTLPKRALFVWGFYIDPDPLTHQKGAIYIWVILPKTHSANPLAYTSADPRAYKLPYDEPTAEQVQKATQQTQAGKQVEIRTGSAKITHSGKNGSGSSHGKPHFRDYTLPPGQLPAKQR